MAGNDFEDFAFHRNRCPRPGEGLLALFRAAHHLTNHQAETDLTDAILTDAVAVLDARRGAIILADNKNQLHLQAFVGDSSSPPFFSQELAERVMSAGESVLCVSAEQNDGYGAMATSVLCVVLRTAYRKLGVLHLDRGVGQLPFNEDDLHLADALAVSLSMGLECTYLTRQSLNK